ncbi:MAG: AI-2E family transporter [Phycisphaeraceae bacterium]
MDRSEPPYLPLWVTALLCVAVLALLGWYFETVALVLLLFLAAAAIASLLRPLRRYLLPGHPGLAGLLLGLMLWVGVVGVLTLVSVLLATRIEDELARWPELARQIDATVQQFGRMVGLGENVTLRGLLLQALNWLAGEEDVIAVMVDRAGVAVIGVVLLVFGSMFLMMEPEGRLTRPLSCMLPVQHRPLFLAAFGDIESRLRWWVVGTMASMGVVGVLAYIGLTIVGLDFALPLAMLAGLAEIVPVLGPTIAFLIILLFAVTQDPALVLGVAIVWLIIQIVEPYVIVPTVMRQALRIPPLVTLFTVVLWARMLGPLGLVLAIPLNLTLWSFLERFVVQRHAEREQARGGRPCGEEDAGRGGGGKKK